MFAKAKDIQLFADLDDFDSAGKITGHSLRPDILIIFNQTLYIIELTVGFESNVNSNSIQKMHEYSELVHTFHQNMMLSNFLMYPWVLWECLEPVVILLLQC